MNWFVRKGIFYKPNSPMGWLLLVIAIFFATYKFFAINSSSLSVGNTLISWTPQLIIIAVVYSTIGFLTVTE